MSHDLQHFCYFLFGVLFSVWYTWSIRMQINLFFYCNTAKYDCIWLTCYLKETIISFPSSIIYFMGTLEYGESPCLAYNTVIRNSLGRALPYLKMICTSDIFRSHWVLYWTWSYWPFFLQKISLSLSYLVPEIIGPKFGLTFHHCHLVVVKHFVYILFSLIFSPVDLFVVLKPFWPSTCFYKSLNLIGSIFIVC